jgi:pyrimidine operon attenuation protein/uracil phosphoribosyltransferase
MNEIFDYGRPARIDLAVLVDRGGRELPVCPRWSAQALQIEPGKNLQLERSKTGVLSLRLIDA